MRKALGAAVVIAKVLVGAFVVIRSIGNGPGTNQNHNYPLDLGEQAMIYRAFYDATNSRGWVFGFYLFGYGFTDAPLAVDVTLNGKPAEALSSAWAQATGSQS